MSRALAGLGAVAGAAVGTVAGIVISGYVPPQPDTPEDDRNLAAGVEAVGAAIGAFVGAFVGAGSDQPSKQVGVGRAPPRFP